MTKNLHWGWLVVCVLLLLGCGDPDCPDGTVYSGKRCIYPDAGRVDADGGRQDDAGVSDGGVVDAPMTCADRITCFEDADLDGRARLGAGSTEACTCASGWTDRAPDLGHRDCDDEDPDRYDGAVETCDGKDNDCDGSADEELPLIACYLDADRDGFGNADDVVQACECASDRTTRSDLFDCNDETADAYPGQSSFFEPIFAPGCTICSRTWGDFNCDGTQESRWTNVHSACSWDPVSATCSGDGWDDTRAILCGLVGTYVRCRVNATASGCRADSETRYQQCR